MFSFTLKCILKIKCAGKVVEDEAPYVSYCGYYKSQQIQCGLLSLQGRLLSAAGWLSS